MFPPTESNVCQEVVAFDPMLVYANSVIAIIIMQILMKYSIKFEILVQKEIKSFL